MQDKDKQIFELYEEKSKIYKTLSELNDNSKYFVLGYGSHSYRQYGPYEFTEFGEDFIKDIKQQCIDYLNNRLNEINNQIEKIFKC